MTIGVYRIYVGAGWARGERLQRLTAVLDAMPTFYYRIDRVCDADLAAAAANPAVLQSFIRIAMTQSHIAIVDPMPDSAEPFMAIEAELARKGFRRRIPVLGVCEAGRGPERSQSQSPATPAVDLVVDLGTGELAVAIQELAELAAAERRRADQLLLDLPMPAASPATANLAHRPRAANASLSLPVPEIIQALASLKASRDPA